jgi:hypothetical protein
MKKERGGKGFRIRRLKKIDCNRLKTKNATGKMHFILTFKGSCVRGKGTLNRRNEGGGGDSPVAANLKVSASKRRNERKDERRDTISIIFTSNFTRLSI